MVAYCLQSLVVFNVQIKRKTQSVLFNNIWCSNLKIAIETGRWTRISREQRLCTLCGNGVGDEYHLLFTCVHPVVSELRSKFIPNYYKTNPNMNKFGGLLSICNVQVHKKLAIFLKKVMKYLWYYVCIYLRYYYVLPYYVCIYIYVLCPVLPFECIIHVYCPLVNLCVSEVANKILYMKVCHHSVMLWGWCRLFLSTGCCTYNSGRIL